MSIGAVVIAELLGNTNPKYFSSLWLSCMKSTWVDSVNLSCFSASSFCLEFRDLHVLGKTSCQIASANLLVLCRSPCWGTPSVMWGIRSTAKRLRFKNGTMFYQCRTYSGHHQGSVIIVLKILNTGLLENMTRRHPACGVPSLSTSPCSPTAVTHRTVPRQHPPVGQQQP